MEKADPAQARKTSKAIPLQMTVSKHPKPGDLCPVCKKEVLDYDGMLNLVCPKCGLAEGGCFT